MTTESDTTAAAVKHLLLHRGATSEQTGLGQGELMKAAGAGLPRSALAGLLNVGGARDGYRATARLRAYGVTFTPLDRVTEPRRFWCG